VLCLVQVATCERLAVVDPLAVRDLGPFWSVVLDPAIDVVMHAAGEDLRICLLQAGRLPRRVFDVQIAAGLAGLTYPLSLVNLVGQVLDVGLAGSETRTDWRVRPLSPAQLQYALDDVRHLLAASDRLADRLNQRGRTDWAEAEFADLAAAVWRPPGGSRNGARTKHAGKTGRCVTCSATISW
jgi:ribonuclease D